MHNLRGHFLWIGAAAADAGDRIQRPPITIVD
jgi:hypothetical protein